VSVETLPIPLDAAPPAASVPAPIKARLEAPLVFTGSGAEYFRIWVVNTLLSIATIGIYSAWAKVRKSSYFLRNTRLLGDGFEFTGDPLAILRGRLVALALLGFYTFAYDFSLALGLFATAMLLALAPLLFASAMRFRLHNTRWRAMRFAFTATRADAYRAVLIVIALWSSTGVVAALDGEASVIAVSAATLLLLLPWMHHRLKAFQHRHVAFAAHRSGFRSAAGSFYLTYLIALLVPLLPGLAALAAPLIAALFGSPAFGGPVLPILGSIAAVLGYLAAWPYFAARIQRIVWERTTLGPFSFKTTIAFRPLLSLAITNFVLILLTAGLYWPFASIAWARYRIGCMSIAGPESLDAAISMLDPGAAANAIGEGAADFFGIDIGW
jgi:uncharacterized membrane protein YjgN (DUF898 family)